MQTLELNLFNKYRFAIFLIIFIDWLWMMYRSSLILRAGAVCVCPANLNIFIVAIRFLLAAVHHHLALENHEKNENLEKY